MEWNISKLVVGGWQMTCIQEQATLQTIIGGYKKNSIIYKELKISLIKNKIKMDLGFSL